MKVYRISDIRLRVKDMEKSCALYSKIPGFSLTYGGKPSDRFTTFEIGKGSNATAYLNLELMEVDEGSSDFYKNRTLEKPEIVKILGGLYFILKMWIHFIHT
jgi:hypothetical protein